MLGAWATEDSSDQVEDMDTSEARWCWLYFADCGEWHMFKVNPSDVCSLTSNEIEQNYNRNRTGIMEYHVGGCTYRFDFSEMKQINITTGKQRPIKRVPHTSTSCRFLCDAFALSVPSHWETDLPYQLIPLRRDTKECKDIMKRFARTMPESPIKSIQRIQNLHLWELFFRKREQLGRLKQMNLEEKMLFHGTDFGNVRSICSSNFDLRLAGRHGSVYGKGIYFARNASYAHKYCKSLDSQKGMQPLKAMFLARVLVGSSHSEKAGFAAPPPKTRPGPASMTAVSMNFSIQRFL